MVGKYRKTATTLIKGAKTLDRKYYTDKEVFYSELENIFYENWLCIGRCNEINNKGSYITIDIGSESLIVVRDDKNLLKKVDASKVAGVANKLQLYNLSFNKFYIDEIYNIMIYKPFLALSWICSKLDCDIYDQKVIEGWGWLTI